MVLSYIQIPLFVDFYIINKIKLSVGPEFAFMLGAVAKSKSNHNDITSIYDNRFEVSGAVSAAYAINEKFDVGLRYNHGLTSLVTLDVINTEGEKVGKVAQYNQYFQLFFRFIVPRRK